MQRVHVLIPMASMPLLALLLSRLAVLPGVALALLVIVCCGALAPVLFARLAARLKWIWLSLLLIYSGFTPGEYCVLTASWLPCTYEGLLGGAVQVLHLLAMLALVGCVLQHYSNVQLLAGIYQWLRAWGVSEKRLHAVVARLSLVLAMQLQKQTLDAHAWLDYFKQPESLLHGLSMRTVSLELSPLRRLDRLLLGLMLSAMLGLLVYG